MKNLLQFVARSAVTNVNASKGGRWWLRGKGGKGGLVRGMSPHPSSTEVKMTTKKIVKEMYDKYDDDNEEKEEFKNTKEEK